LTDDNLDGFVADVTTIAQSQCEHATDYADIEALVCDLPTDHLTFAAHDSLAVALFHAALFRVVLV
jgi:putative transposase